MSTPVLLIPLLLLGSMSSDNDASIFYGDQTVDLNQIESFLKSSRVVDRAILESIRDILKEYLIKFPDQKTRIEKIHDIVNIKTKESARKVGVLAKKSPPQQSFLFGKVVPFPKNEFRIVLNEKLWNEGKGFYLTENFFEVDVQSSWKDETPRFSLGENGRFCGSELYRKTSELISREFADYLARENGGSYNYNDLPPDYKKIYELIVTKFDDDANVAGHPFAEKLKQSNVHASILEACANPVCSQQVENIIEEFETFADEYFLIKTHGNTSVIENEIKMFITKFRDIATTRAADTFPILQSNHLNGRVYDRNLFYLFGSSIEGVQSLKDLFSEAMNVRTSNVVFWKRPDGGRGAKHYIPGTKRSLNEDQKRQLIPGVLYTNSVRFSTNKMAKCLDLSILCEEARASFITLEESKKSKMELEIEDYLISFKKFEKLILLTYGKNDFKSRLNQFLESDEIIEKGDETGDVWREKLINWREERINLSLKELRIAIEQLDALSGTEYQKVPELLGGTEEEKRKYFFYTVFPFYLCKKGFLLV